MLELALAVPLAFLVGLSLGLLGGGGSILAVPILVYLLGLAPKPAIATSLVVVGVTSLTGALRHARHGNLDARVGLGFGIAGIAGASAGSRIAAMEAVPGTVLLFAFALLMVVVAATMLRRPPGAGEQQAPEVRRGIAPARVLGFGLLTGFLTGLLGVGGGFIIVPTLVLAAGLPMRLAVGTSLLVIAINCAAGLVGFLGRVPIRWTLAGIFTLAGVAGSLAGANLAARTHPQRLRRGFAVFLLLAGTAMLIEKGLEIAGG
mgnify:CR=1 FL=1